MNNEKKWGKGVYDLISWFKKDRVENACVLVAGAGALGNEILKNLALFGVGNIFIVDFDTIEYSNLTRSILYRESDADKGLYKAEVAAARVREINPEINVHSIVGRLGSDVGLGVYRRMNVAIGGLDSPMARVELNRLCMRANIPWVNGGIENLKGEASVYCRGIGCYECGLTVATKRKLASRYSCADVAQDAIKQGRIPTTPVIASIIGAIEVEEAMKIIHEGVVPENYFKTLKGRMLRYDGNNHICENIKMSVWKNSCEAHELWEPVVEIEELGADNTIEETFAIIKQRLGCEHVEINLRNDKFVDSLEIHKGHKTFRPMLPQRKVYEYINSHEELKGRSTGSINQHAIDYIDEEFPYQYLTLEQVGIPYLDILQVSTENDYVYVEMTRDTNRYKL